MVVGLMVHWTKEVVLTCGHSINEYHSLSYGGSETFEIVQTDGKQTGICPVCEEPYPTDYWGGFEMPKKLTLFQEELKRARKN